jgi:DNA polymerase III subunit delta
MDMQKIQQNIRKNNIAPVYVLYGTQQLLIEETLRTLSEHLLDQESAEFNYETFDLTERPVQEAVAAAETMPFLGEKRVVVASGALFLTGARTKDKVEHSLESLERYVQDPAEYSVLVLTADTPKLDGRKKLVQQLKKHAVVGAAADMKEQELIPWVVNRACDHGVTIAEEAAALLVHFVGEHMLMLTNEIEKMVHYVGSGEIITPSVVQELIAKTVEQDVFTLVDHVVQARMEQALLTLHELLKKNEEPIKILFLLARQFRIIYRVQQLVQQGFSTKQMGSILQVHPFACKIAARQAKAYSAQQLARILDEAAEADYQMKSGRMDKVLALEMFLLRLNAQQKGHRLSPS